MATPQLSVPVSRGKGTVGGVVYVLLSYLLALGMLPYAVSKIIGIQFRFLPPPMLSP